MVKIGIGQVELMSKDCEGLAGAPMPPREGRGGGRSQMTPEQQEAQRLQRENLKKWRMSSSPMSTLTIHSVARSARSAI